MLRTTGALAVYGDDFICCTEKSGLTIEDFKKPYKEIFNLILTHWTKKEEYDPDTWATASFLSRKFVNDRGTVRAPLPLRTIVESLYWIKGDQNPNILVTQVFQSVMIELCHHGKDVYERELDKILAEAHKRMPGTFRVLQQLRRPYGEVRRSMYETQEGIVMKYAPLN
jgi:hypothetical protein